MTTIPEKKSEFGFIFGFVIVVLVLVAAYTGYRRGAILQVFTYNRDKVSLAGSY